MKKYRTWVDGRRPETEAVVEASTGWDARKIVAERYNVKPAIVVAAHIVAGYPTSRILEP